MERRFPPPWTAEVTPNCFIVRDANGQALSKIYYESEPGRRSAAKLLSKDEARRIAATKSVSPKTAKHAFEPRTHWRKGRHRCGADVAWLHWRAGRRLGSYPLGCCLSLNSTNGVLQQRTLTVEVYFVKRTLAKLVRLHGACAIVDGAPVFKSIYL
jgi:hypothetical protein